MIVFLAFDTAAEEISLRQSQNYQWQKSISQSSEKLIFFNFFMPSSLLMTVGKNHGSLHQLYSKIHFVYGPTSF